MNEAKGTDSINTLLSNISKVPSPICVRNDPDQSKVCTTPFMVYQNRVRDDIINEHPGISVTDLNKIVSEMWEKLTDPEKQKYIEIAKNTVASPTAPKRFTTRTVRKAVFRQPSNSDFNRITVKTDPEPVEKKPLCVPNTDILMYCPKLPKDLDPASQFFWAIGSKKLFN